MTHKNDFNAETGGKSKDASFALLQAIKNNDIQNVRKAIIQDKAEMISVHLQIAAKMANDTILDTVIDNCSENNKDLCIQTCIHNSYTKSLTRLLTHMPLAEDYEVSVLFAEAAAHDQKKSFFTLCQLGYDPSVALEEIKETVIFGVNARYDMDTVEKMHKFHLSYMSLTRGYYMDEKSLHKEVKETGSKNLFKRPLESPEASGLAFLAARAGLFSAFIGELNKINRLDDLTNPNNYTEKDHNGHSLIDILIVTDQAKLLFNEKMWSSANSLKEFATKVLDENTQDEIDIKTLSAAIARNQIMHKKATRPIRFKRRK